MTSTHSDGSFLIVALGASAGGLEPLEKFFTHMPTNADIACVVVQHLAPDHPTALPEILARYTRMPVEAAHDQTKAVPNRVYIISPNTTLTIKDGTLRVAPPTEARGYRTPIDSLFRSLAEDRREHAVCIMLSGTGSDGTIGLRAIKEHGGMAMAQALETAKYDAILRSAIATGLVDHVLKVEEMPAKLLEYAAHLRSFREKPDHVPEELSTQLGKIFELIRRRSGHDFSQYKQGTVVRRLQRRINASQIDTVEQYIELLKRQPKEIDLFLKDLLIGVTEFFRDPEAFEALRQLVIPKLFEEKGADGSVRACVVGCSSGQEAYSIAILLSEYASTLTDPPKIQIFATDIDERGLEVARKGRYPLAAAEDVSPERLARFFIREDGSYQVKRELRERIIFSTHSFIKDPPFSRLDLISCRNVMIYLGVDLQRKILPLFHYALRADGYLFLGPSEGVTSNRELFEAVDKKHQIFQRNEFSPPPQVAFPSGAISRPRDLRGRKQPGESSNEERGLLQQLERIILQRYRPACVAVREDGNAIYFSGSTSRYLEQPTGSPDTNVLAMAREGLSIPLRSALHHAVSNGERAVQRHIPVQINGRNTHVNLTVEPVLQFQHTFLYIITFEDSPDGSSRKQGEVTTSAVGSDEIIQHLESELRSAHERAQAMYEELETSNEELRSTNEEFLSTNEELETSKEELQSFNEELETVNAELSRKVADLDTTNNDLQNLLNSTKIATLFLDSELRVKNFTPSAAGIFRLISGDIGRPITDLAAEFADEDFVSDIKEVLRTHTDRERQLAGGGRHFQMRVLPYRSIHNVVDGVVVTFTDVTALKEAEMGAAHARTYAEKIVHTVHEPLLVLDAELHVISANNTFYETFKVPAEDTINKSLYQLGNGQWDIPELRHLMGELLPQRKTVADFEVTQDFTAIGRKVMLLNARQIDDLALILVAIEDITKRKQAEDELQRLNEDLRHFSYAASHDLQEPLRMVISYTQLLGKEFKGKLGAKADRYAAIAIEGAERMETLLRDLREFWSVNEQQLSVLVPVDCNRVLDLALQLLAAPIRDEAGFITHDLLPTVVAEEVPLVMLLQNLIGNSLKYHRPKEHPQIHISAERGAQEWKFSVRDNGIGIEPAHSRVIFSPFKRLHGGEIPGSGLGLAICERIVLRFGGRIWVDSEYGRGSTFFFTIPERKE